MEHSFSFSSLGVLCLLATPHVAQQGRTAEISEGLERSSWFAEVSAELQTGEYRFSPVEGEAGVWSAPSRAQDFRSRVSARGIEVLPRKAGVSGTGAEWKLVLATKSFGRTGHAAEPDAATVRVTNDRAELDHGRLREWFVNEERGLEQGWTIASAPSGVEPLWIGLEVGGDFSLRIDEGGRSGRFVDATGELRLCYTGLMAFDATGRELEARLAPSPHGAGIAIDDAGAVYPLTVDPILTGPAWTAESDQQGADFGLSVAAAGDVNDDGYGDVIVGAFGYDNGQSNEGRAFLYHGSGAGLSTSAAWTAEGDQLGAGFGYRVACAGDVNGDGYSDVVVAAWKFNNGQANEGRVFLYLGSGAGLATSAAWTAESDQAQASFGSSVATAGDVNGDGYGDVLVGAYQYDNGQANEGRAFLYMGSGAGLSASAAWTAESDQDDAAFGYSVATAGDVNGDGYSDVLVGALQYDNGQVGEGRAFLYVGSRRGLSTNAPWTAESDQASAGFGYSVAPAGDVNGDGYGDALVGAPFYDNGQANEGRAFLYLGSGAGLSASAAWTAESDQAGAQLGYFVAPAGDVNGDGHSDVILGANLYDHGQADEGRALVYLGSGAGLSTSAAWTAESDQADAWFGYSVSAAGDVNGDGYSDVIVGAWQYDNGEASEGRAFVYLGSSAGLSTGEAWTAESDQGAAFLGYSVATAGDVNGDGYTDVIVGAFGYSNGQTGEGRALVYLGSGAGPSTSAAWTAESDQAGAAFGFSVATAGDVNGDGYSDVIVGAPYYDNGQTDEGRAFLYLGSGAGLSTNAAWTAESDQASAVFGVPVATAGDVNGDGYGDVIIAAPSYDNGQTDEGRAFLYLGSGAGLSSSAAWTAESDQNGAQFGSSAATGDVDGDGFSDVIVSAYSYDNDETDEGRAYLYLGSGAGLSTNAAWTAEGNQADARFGYPVATAGDVNGDGYSDVIVGSHTYDNGQTDEGRVFLYLGSGAGLSTGSAWTAESDQNGASFGYSVATAGDVNGDGYSDVIVGATLFDNGQTDEGRAFLYLGSGTGLSTGSAWTAESDQAGAQFGCSVATAGDVNGDGYSDVLVGAWVYSNGQTDEGRAFVYLGNEGRGGRVLATQQRRLFAPKPIASLGRSDAHGFRIQVEHPALVGGGLAFLEWEVKPLGVPFDGLGLGRSALGQPVDPFSALSFDELVLPNGDRTLPYKWRARVVLEGNPFFPSTPWFSPPDNARTETDLRLQPRLIRQARR